jgi:hypothetical protein
MNYMVAVQALADAGVDFVIIGGWSAILHGSSALTNDLDICYSRRTENLKRLAAALSPFRPRLRDLPPELPFVWDEATLRNNTVLTLTTDLGDVDLLAEVAGLGDFEQVKSKSLEVQGFDRAVWTLDLPGLIQAKRAAGRAKDLRILPELEGLLELREPEE